MLLITVDTPTIDGSCQYEHKLSIDKALRCENKNDNFDSALGLHIFKSQIVWFFLRKQF